MQVLRGLGRRREADRDAAVRRGKVLVTRHVEKQRAAAARLWDLARRALRIDDRTQFEQIARQYVWTIEDIRRWERYGLSIEALEARRDQARGVADFMDAVSSVSAA